jgi:hypothetical protein
VAVRELFQVQGELNTYIKRVCASLVMELYELPEGKYRDYAEFEECPTGLNITMIDIHGFTEDYWVAWSALENASI